MNDTVNRFLLLGLLCSSCIPLSATSVETNAHHASPTEATFESHADALIEQAKISLIDSPVIALEQAHRALQIAEQSGVPEAEHRALGMVAEVQERMGLYTEYLQSTMRMLELAQVMASVDAIVRDLQRLSNAYRYNGRTGASVDEARRALGMILPTQDRAAIVEAELFLTKALLAAGQFDEAVQGCRRALDRLEGEPEGRSHGLIWTRMAEILLAQEKWNDVLPLATKAKRVLAKEGDADDRFDVLLACSHAYTGMGSISEARALNAEADELLEHSGSWENRNALLAARYACALAAKKHEEALAYLQQLKHLDDSLYQDRVALKMAGLQVLYQLASKEKDNAALRDINAQQSSVLETVIQRSRVVAILAIVMFILVVALYFISRYAIKTLRRSKLKNEVIRKQHEEIQAKNLELQRQNLRLAESLIGEEEKEIVIKEIHHRVKNNLQVVDSLLSLQSGQQEDPQVTRLFKEAQGRIRSMALVHEHIYRTAGQHVGPLKEYLEQLARNVLVAYGAHDRVSVTVQTQEVVFPMETLMPLSLVVNELMTNAVKYAFREQDCGHISIVVRPSGNGHELLFNDDGGGMGHDPILPERSFGLELIRMLAHQLNGEVHILKGTGTTVSMSFASDALPLRAAS